MQRALKPRSHTPQRVQRTGRRRKVVSSVD
jgi:hypothetical protein